jgi:acyl-CoA dehydrogenase
MIDFELTDNDREILKLAHEQATAGQRHDRYYDRHEDELPPQEFPEANDFPDLRDLARAREGTSGARILDALIIAESLGAVPLRRTRTGLGNTVLAQVADSAQRERWKNLSISIAMTEPAAGSDPANIRTTAIFDRETGEWVLNGEKIFISQGETADAAMVLARFVGPDKSEGMSTFLVEKGTPGFTIGHQLRKMGIRSWDTVNLRFEDCRIPDANHIRGNFKKTLTVFNDSRPLVGAMALAVCRAALDFTRAKLTEQGVAIDYAGGVRSRSAAADRFLRLEAAYEAALLCVLRSKWLEQQSEAAKLEASIAKSICGRACRRITQGCIELLGPEALSEDHLLEKWFRDGRIFDIFEGTGEIQRLIIARTILGYSSRELR